MTTTDPTPLILSCFQKALGHELPNLLVAAQGIARLLSLEVAPDSEERLLLDRLATAIQKTDGLVRRLAALGRTLREPPRVEAVALDDLLAEVAAEVRATRGMPTARLEVPAPLPTIQTDRDRLRQALIQVLRNAHQAARTELPLTIRVEWGDSRHELRIIDTGRGLPGRPVESLLQPFHPANPGQGLGLFTVHAILTSLGGSVGLESTPEAGTTVTLCLPQPPGA